MNDAKKLKETNQINLSVDEAKTPARWAKDKEWNDDVFWNETQIINGVKHSRHPNGGEFVADTATCMGRLYYTSTCMGRVYYTSKIFNTEIK